MSTAASMSLVLQSLPDLSAHGVSRAEGDETVREDVLWSEATADSVTAETRALLDDNPFERPQYSLRPQTHDQLARVRAAANPSSSQKNPGSTPSKPYALPTKDSRRSTEERNWARALLLCSEDWAGCAVNEKNFDAAIKFVRPGLGLFPVQLILTRFPPAVHRGLEGEAPRRPRRPFHIVHRQQASSAVAQRDGAGADPAAHPGRRHQNRHDGKFSGFLSLGILEADVSTPVGLQRLRLPPR